MGGQVGLKAAATQAFHVMTPVRSRTQVMRTPDTPHDDDWLTFNIVETGDLATFNAFDVNVSQRARLPRAHECKINEAMLRDLRTQAGDCVLLRWDSFTIE